MHVLDRLWVNDTLGDMRVPLRSLSRSTARLEARCWVDKVERPSTLSLLVSKLAESGLILKTLMIFTDLIEPRLAASAVGLRVKPEVLTAVDAGVENLNLGIRETVEVTERLVERRSACRGEYGSEGVEPCARYLRLMREDVELEVGDRGCVKDERSWRC